MSLFINKSTDVLNDTKRIHRRKSLFIITVILSIVGLTFFKIGQELYQPNVTQLEDQWEFIVKDHSDHFLVGSTNQRIKMIDANHELIMSQELTDKLAHPIILLKTNHQWTDVYLDRSLLYHYQPTKKNQQPGLLFTSLTLPKDYQGKKLRIITQTPLAHYAGIPAQIFLGEASEVNQYFGAHALPQLFLALFCFTLAILLLSSLRVKTLRIKTIPLIGLASLIGIKSLFNSIPIGAMFSATSLSTVECLSALLIPLCLTIYYLTQMKKYQRLYFAGVLIQLILLVSSLLAVALRQVPLAETLAFGTGFNVFMTLFTASIALGESFLDNHFFVICSPGIVIAAIIHCFFYIQLFIGAANFTTDWPTLLFTGLLLLISGYHLVAYQKATTRQQKMAQMKQVHTVAQKQKNEFLLTYFTQQAPDGNSLSQIFDYYTKKCQQQNGTLHPSILFLAPDFILSERYALFLINRFEEIFEKLPQNPKPWQLTCSIRQVQQHLLIEWSEERTDNFFESRIATADAAQEMSTLTEEVEKLAGYVQQSTSVNKQHFKAKFLILT